MASPRAPLASQAQPQAQRKQHLLHTNPHDENEATDDDDSSDQGTSVSSASRSRPSSRTAKARISSSPPPSPPTTKPRSRPHKRSERKHPDHLAAEMARHPHHRRLIPQNSIARRRMRSVPTVPEDEIEGHEDDAEEYDDGYDGESEAQEHLVSIPPLTPLPPIIDPPEGEKLVAGGKKAKLAVELKLNLEIEIQLRAYIHGDLTLELFN